MFTKTAKRVRVVATDVASGGSKCLTVYGADAATIIKKLREIVEKPEESTKDTRPVRARR